MSQKLLIVEDDERFRRGLAKTVGAAPGLELVAEAGTGEEGLSLLAEWTPDLVLLDLELPGMHGLDFIEHSYRSGGSHDILVLTTFDDEEKVYRAVKGGAAGYLTKSAGPDRIIDAIGEIANGGVVIEPRIARRFWNHFDSVRGAGPAPGAPALDELEREVLLFVVKGLTNREVGEVLDIPRRSVRTHLARLYGKLGVRNRVEAVVAALRMGRVDI